MAVLGRDDFVRCQIDVFGRGHDANFLFGPDQHRHDHLSLRGFKGAEQRIAIARMDNGAADRRQRLAAAQERREAVIAA